jgi:UDP-D-galactose:(glucosyl)LPS alpha-1,3-D-galactosyltransferase
VTALLAPLLTGLPVDSSLPPIVCGVDYRYVPGLAALMESMAVAHGDARGQLRMVIAHRDLGATDCREIDRRAARLGLSVDFRVVRLARSLPVSGWVSDAVYLRLGLPELLPDESRALYLDGDVLVMRDLRPLLRHPMCGAALAAVRDPQNPIVGEGIALPGWHQIGVPRGREYFNSGVMLIDLHECARQGVFERAYRFLIEWPREVRLWDQDALNVAVDDRWHRLDRCWNTFAMSALTTVPGFIHDTAEPVMPLADLLADEYSAAVLHFAGPTKPWAADYPPVALRDLYRRFITPVDGATR